MKNIFTSLLLISFFLNLSAEISVKSFRKLDNDMTARIDAPKKDQNGDVCAVIKVVTTQTGFLLSDAFLLLYPVKTSSP